MNPRDYKTWTSFAEHPIFSDRKFAIKDWSSDPSAYCDLDNYTTFLVEWYVHRNPKLPTEMQARYAARDIRSLADSCAAIEREFGPSPYELIILDDFTVFVRLAASRLVVEIYPDNLSDDGTALRLFVDLPGAGDLEYPLSDVADVVPTLRSVLAQL